MAATTGAGAAALTGVIPMAPDEDSAQFAAALNAAGAAYIAMANQHVGERTAFSGAQSLASTTSSAGSSSSASPANATSASDSTPRARSNRIPSARLRGRALPTCSPR